MTIQDCEFALSIRKVVAKRSIRHWLVFLGLLIVTMAVGAWLDQLPVGLPFRYSVFQRLAEVNPFALKKATHTVPVLIDDEAYYDDNNGRRPLSLQYLGNIIRHLDALEASVIAIDLDLSSPDPEHLPKTDSPLSAELNELLSIIHEVSVRRPVILPVALSRNGDIRRSMLEGAAENSPGKIHFGLVNLAQDVRYIPLEIRKPRSAEYVDSFSLAIAKAKLQGGLESKGILGELVSHVRISGERPPMAVLLRRDATISISAADLFRKTDSGIREKIQGRAAIVGGTWNERTRGSGFATDSYETPVGEEQGVFLHASYAEALISDRVYRLAPSPWLTVFKFTSLLVLGVVVVIAERGWTKILWIGSTLMVNLGAAYFLFTNIGLAADAALPILFILGHPLIDQVNEWRRIAWERSGRT